jgi:hypothetical protein
LKDAKTENRYHHEKARPAVAWVGLRQLALHVPKGTLYLLAAIADHDGVLTGHRGSAARTWLAKVMQQPGASASPRLLQINGQVANLCVSVELEHRHRVHDVGTLIPDVSLFEFEVHQLGQLGDPLHRGLERVD